MIIGLTGYAQSGKDTVAALLVEHYGFKRVAFADKIRDLLLEMDPPVPMEDGKVVGLQNLVEVYGWDEAKQNPIVRSMLQNLGVGARKVFGKNHWVVEVFKDMDMYDTDYVITDVRFANEAEFIRTFNGNIWRVTRPGVGPVNGHVSESELDSIEVDHVINNDGDFKDLMVELQSAYDL